VKLTATASAIVLLVTAHAAAQADNILTRTTAKSPDAVVAAIKAYADEKKWLYLGDNKVKQGEITLVKLCIPAVAAALWPVGPQVSALLPCGNVGVYRKGDVTEISMLHPRFMQVLHPHAATERASALAGPLLGDMLDTVTK
jgi:hypothetical protein